MCKFKKIVGINDLSDQFRKKKVVNVYNRNENNLNAFEWTACLAVNQNTVDIFVALFHCAGVVASGVGVG